MGGAHIGGSCGCSEHSHFWAKTDWAHQGCISSHTTIPPEPPMLTYARFVLWEICRICPPRKFDIGLNNTFVACENGSAITSSQLAALLRSAVFKRCLNPSVYSIHSLRDGSPLRCTLPPGMLNWRQWRGDGAQNQFRHIFGKSSNCSLVWGDLIAVNPQTLHMAKKRLGIKQGLE